MALYTFALIALIVHTSASQSLKPVPVGQILPIGTLFPRDEQIQSNEENVMTRNTTDVPTRSNQGTVPGDFVSLMFDIDNDFLEDEDSNESSDDEGDYDKFSDRVPYADVNGQTLVRKGLMKRTPAFRGTMQFDCKRAWEACQNACWY